MKVPNKIRIIYDELKGVHERLKSRVDDTLEPYAKERRWHYESRIKSDLSVALKLETGRIPNPRSIEDFFACMLVVRNITEIDSAEKLIENNFSIKYRRPRDNKRTNKSSSSFHFDDLRLYVNLKKDERLPPSVFDEITFEIQVKTFLQHAWSIATHNLIYKTDEVNWSKERIAYQIKAMLEHAELSIQEADILCKTSFLEKEDRETSRIKEVTSILQEIWPSELLPSDMRRLAQNVNGIIESFRITTIRLT